MKYILLDFDGVLTSSSYTWLCHMEKRPANLFGMDWFDPRCLDALRTLVERTGAKIIVSSSWRDLSTEQLKWLWEQVPMPGEFCGTTPIWILTKKGAIKHWINKHPDDRWVILDDIDLGFPNQVRTDPHTGLSEADVQQAIKVLNADEENPLS